MSLLRKKQFIGLLCVASTYLSLGLSCSDNLQPTPQDSGWADPFQDSTHRDSGPDIGIENDADLPSTDAAHPVWLSAPEPERWKYNRPCNEPELAFEPVTDEPFAVPDTPDFKSALTKQDFIGIWGVPLPISYSVFADSKYGTRREFQSDLFVEPGDDVTFRVHISEPNDDGHFLVTPMLDYEPVEVLFERYTSDRQRLVEELQDTGYNFDTIDRFDPVDITFPAEAFSTGRTHEVAIAVRVADFPFRLKFFYRFSVHYGGFAPPRNRPCFAAPLGDVWNTAQYEQSPADEFDQAINAGFVGSNIAGIFTNPTPPNYASAGVGTPMDVAPGETVELFSTIYRQTREIGPTPVFLQPTLDGRPVGQGWWRSFNGPGRYNSLRYIDARDRFEVTLPDAPGIYHVMLRAFPHPWERWREFEEPREEIREVFNRRLSEGSNVLRFRVTDDE